jgi:hypothetical protein
MNNIPYVIGTNRGKNIREIRLIRRIRKKRLTNALLSYIIVIDQQHKYVYHRNKKSTNFSLLR